MRTISERQRQVKQQAAQEAIYEAALEVISRPDFDGLKMQDIAASAGIVTGTLYLYFKNKEDLLYYVDRKLHEVIL
ncbi:MAG: helix-turn-helix domain-containing protein, partial [Planctomycetota bacterium]